MKSKLYHLDRKGVLDNINAYKVEPITGNLESYKFVAHLKNTVESEFGVGMSLNTIVTGCAGMVVFHFKKDYDYYIKKAKESWIINKTSNPMKEPNERYTCLECGRNTFLYKAWHQCNGEFKNPGKFRKRTIKIKS